MYSKASCPVCGSEHVKKNGFYKAFQKYRCLDCNAVFNEQTKTLFSSKKLSEETVRKLLLLLIDDSRLKVIRDILHISIRTAYFWRIKIYKLAGYLISNIRLSGRVYIDELLVPVNRKYLVTKNGKQYRGHSRNQIVIACAIDDKKNKFISIVGKGHITSKQCIESYGKVIEKGSYIIHDGVFSHDKLIAYLESKDEVWKSISKESKKHMQPINSLCAEITRNLTVHTGLKDENLQDYLNWIVFRSTLTKENINKKIDELVSLCFKFHMIYRIKDRYHK